MTETSVKAKLGYGRCAWCRIYRPRGYAWRKVKCHSDYTNSDYFLRVCQTCECTDEAVRGQHAMEQAASAKNFLNSLHSRREKDSDDDE